MKTKIIYGLLSLIFITSTLFVSFRDYPTGFLGGRFLPDEPNLFSYIKEANERAAANEELNNNGGSSNIVMLLNAPTSAHLPLLDYTKDLIYFLLSLSLSILFVSLFFKKTAKFLESSSFDSNQGESAPPLT